MSAVNNAGKRKSGSRKVSRSLISTAVSLAQAGGETPGAPFHSAQGQHCSSTVPLDVNIQPGANPGYLKGHPHSQGWGHLRSLFQSFPEPFAHPPLTVQPRLQTLLCSCYGNSFSNTDCPAW